MKFRYGGGRRRGAGRMGSFKLRLIIGLIVALVALAGYFFNTTVNPITGETQRVAGLSPEDDVRFGLQAMPEMQKQFGGPSDNAQGQAQVEAVGRKLLVALREVYDVEQMPFEFSFMLLDDDQTVNAFALPGGPTFITDALYNQIETEGQLAGVMGHEVGHVIHRHGVERMAKTQLTQGLTGAAVMAAGDPSAGQVAGMVGQFVLMSYGREDELECDEEGLRLMAAAGYDPRSMIGVMAILKAASGGGGGQPEWASTHPDPANRVARIEAIIKEMYPNGVPEDLRK